MSGATACAKVPKTSVADFVETVLWKNCLSVRKTGLYAIIFQISVSIFLDLLVPLERPLTGRCELFFPIYSILVMSQIMPLGFRLGVVVAKDIFGSRV